MLRTTSTFLVIAVLSALVGTGGIAGQAGGSAALLLWVFLVLFLVGTVAALLGEERELETREPEPQRRRPVPHFQPSRTPMKKQRIRALQGFLLMLALASACETVEGAGRDVEKAGDAIEDAAD